MIPAAPIVFRCRIWPHVHRAYRFGLDPSHYFSVRIYDSAEEKWADYQRIAPRYSNCPIPAGERWQACVLPTYRGNATRLFPLFGIFFGERGWVTGEVVAHEAVHIAALLVRGLSLARSGGERRGRVDLGDNCCRAEERFAYIVSSAVRGITDGLYKTGVWI